MIQQYNNVQIHYVSPVQTVQSKTSGQTFTKQYLVIKWHTEGQYAKDVYREIEVFGKATQLITGFQAGMTVNIEAELGGKLGTDRETQAPKSWTKDSLRSIVAVGGVQQAPQGQAIAQPPVGGYPQVQQQYPQQGVPQQAPLSQPQPGYIGDPNIQIPGAAGTQGQPIDDIPF